MKLDDNELIYKEENEKRKRKQNIAIEISLYYPHRKINK